MDPLVIHVSVGKSLYGKSLISNDFLRLSRYSFRIFLFWKTLFYQKFSYLIDWSDKTLIVNTNKKEMKEGIHFFFWQGQS